MPDFINPEDAEEWAYLRNELEQNVHDARRLGLAKRQGVAPQLRPLEGLPPINRGGMKVLTPGTGFTTVVTNNHSPPEDAEMIAVTIGLTAADDMIISRHQVTELLGRIQWGEGGANFEADFDVYDGIVLCLPACKLKVDVAYPQGSNQGNQNLPIQVNAGFAYGYFGQQSSTARLTRSLGVLDPNGITTVQDLIPKFATSFTLFCCPTSIVNPPVQIVQPATAILVSETTLAAAGERRSYFRLLDNSNLSLHFETQFPLFNGARVITITNNDANVAAEYVIVYNLGF